MPVQDKVTIEELGAKAKLQYPQYLDKTDKELGDAILKTYPVYWDRIKQEEPLGERLKTQFSKGAQQLADPTIGAGKSFLQTARGGSSLMERTGKFLGGKAAEAVGGKQFEPPKQTIAEKAIPESAVQAKGFGQQTGKFAGDVSQFMLAGAAGAGVAPGLAAKTGLGAKMLKGAAQFGGVTAAQTGKFGQESAIAAGMGAAFPAAGAGLKAMFAPERLMGKALGFTGTQMGKLNKIVKPAYKNVQEWALKHGLTGGRKEMLSQLDDIYDAAVSEKSHLLGGIKKQVPNKFSKLLDHLSKKYSTIGNEPIFSEIKKLAGKKALTAQNLDRIRYLADKTLPRGAYAGAEPVATEGIQRVVDGIRKTLGVLDKTGTLRRVNIDKSVIMKMIGEKGLLTQSAGKQVGFSAGARGALGGLVGGAAQMVGVPQLAPVAAGLGLAEGALSFPQVAAPLAQGIRKAGEFGARMGGRTLADIIKAGTIRGVRGRELP